VAREAVRTPYLVLLCYSRIVRRLRRSKIKIQQQYPMLILLCIKYIPELVVWG